MQPHSGFLLVDKPSGPTSYDIIRWIKRKIRNIKIGHCGTLDPLATGLLIVLLGRAATRLQAKFMAGQKDYRFRMRLGIKTNTGDITGAVECRVEKEWVGNADEMNALLSDFVGTREQIPPMFSAIKKEGVPLYKLAREGEVVERKSRKITIHRIEYLGTSAPGEIEIRVTCSGGTYIRSLVEEIGEKMGTVATMTGLVRESVGPFQLRDAVSGERLKSIDAEEIWGLVKSITPEMQ